MTEPVQRASVWRVLGVAMFLASSWTWVIGMWLPVLLMSDFGWSAWFVFAIPNVIGAASVGFLWTSEKSKRFLRQRAGVLAGFSAVTFFFNFLVAGEVVAKGLMHSHAILAYSVLAWLGVCAIAAVGGIRVRLVLATAIWMTSLTMLFLHIAFPDWGWMTVNPTADLPAIASAAGLALVAPAVVLGFLICPHLDATLQYARASLSDRAGVPAFAIGYGLFFLVMIIITFVYGASVIRGGLLTWPVLAHIGLQSAFTVGTHAGVAWQSFAERRKSATNKKERESQIVRFALAGWCGLGMYFLAAGVDGLFADLIPPGNLARFSGTERTMYEVFISAYGLVFPAFALIVMGWPRRGPALPITKARLGIWLGTMAVAGPMMGVGYLGRQYVWVSVAIAVVLLGAWIARKATRTDGQKEPAETAPEAA